jgi:glycosyltransferase involved in cell wall biosynthesis
VLPGANTNYLALDMSNIPCTLIIATYNWPGALGLCLKSVSAQMVLPAEIIIADDGSTAETKKVIDAYRELSTIPVKHLWHKDEGFRKTIILNKAIRAANYGYIIQIDGDIILHRSFIKDHLEYARPGFYIRGSRTLVNKKTTEKLLQNNSIDINFFSAGLVNRLNSVHSSFSSALHKTIIKSNYKNGVIGCNFSYWKKDVVAVNGYNNDITGWGHEDSELGARLINNGIAKRNLKYQAICFHLFHDYFSREREAFNKQMLNKTIADKIVQCANGYSTSPPVYSL